MYMKIPFLPIYKHSANTKTFFNFLKNNSSPGTIFQFVVAIWISKSYNDGTSNLEIQIELNIQINLKT